MCLHDTGSSFNPKWACTGFFIPPLVTLHLHESETKVKLFRFEFGPGSSSIQCEILFWNDINGDRSSFRNETGSRPGQRMRSLIFLWFSAVLLRALYLVWLCCSTSSFYSETLSRKHGTKFCFSFRIKLDPVSCKHTLKNNTRNKIICKRW